MRLGGSLRAVRHDGWLNRFYFPTIANDQW